jgi:Outer membrane protein beta-barrel domain
MKMIITALLQKFDSKTLTRTLLFACFLMGGLPVLHAQFSGGVTTGLQFTRIEGPSEVDAAGTALETFDNITGFYIGPSFSYRFTDRFGIRAEALYSKRGVRYQYKGPSYRNFVLDNNQGTVQLTGNATQQLIVNTHYIDLPLSAYVRLGNFEFHGGGFVSLLAQSVADGSIQFTYQTPNQPQTTVEYNLRYNYRRDGAGEFDDDGATVVAENINGRTATMPKTLGAYYEVPEKKDPLYRSLDYGIHAGASYYLSRSLYIGGRFRYGLADVTNTSGDFARKESDVQGLPVTRADHDRSITIEARVGFSF